MHKRRLPVQVLPCSFVISKEYPILGVFPDARVVDPGCKDHFGPAGVKCPYTKFHVSPYIPAQILLSVWKKQVTMNAA